MFTLNTRTHTKPFGGLAVIYIENVVVFFGYNVDKRFDSNQRGSNFQQVNYLKCSFEC